MKDVVVEPEMTMDNPESLKGLINSPRQRIELGRRLMTLGRNNEALIEFLGVGESLPLWSSFDIDNDPVLDAMRLPIDLSSLTEEQLVVYASWVHHVLLQLTLRLKPWSMSRDIVATLDGSVSSFVRFIHSSGLQRVRSSGYFAVIETLLKQTG